MIKLISTSSSQMTCSVWFIISWIISKIKWSLITHSTGSFVLLISIIFFWTKKYSKFVASIKVKKIHNKINLVISYEWCEIEEIKNIKAKVVLKSNISQFSKSCSLIHSFISLQYDTDHNSSHLSTNTREIDNRTTLHKDEKEIILKKYDNI